jgi:maltooligosyltrehalose trehalohydrolase
MSQRPGQTRWRPTLGAVVHGEGTTFTVWAPGVRRLELVIDPDRGPDSHFKSPLALERGEDGVFSACVTGLGAGRRYRYRLDSSRLLPDPASRYQPEGVHGPSEVVDPGAFQWTDEQWGGVDDRELVIYELHVGTFTPEGTFAGVEARLDHLASLGVTALELMPVAEFAGRWNWGYDGVDLFAPSHRYGTPDDLRCLVDAAHARGLGVILDVVYNHLGPDGAYVSSFSPYYFNGRHKSPWGDAVNLDGPHSERVRAFFVENALHWIHEYHLDGLRLDATHALQDDSEVHFLAELALRVDERAGDRCIVLVAEDERNLDRLVRPPAHGGFGLDAVWSDDFHHHLRRHLAGDAHGYFRCFSGQTGDIATTIRRGWFFVGRGGGECESRGTDPSGIPLHRFVFCLQNHDQVGNRAFGDRLHHQVDLAAYRAAAALLLCAPETPLLFMGQEWAASSPFLYFTDHEPELGSKVTEGRRSEFSAFPAFADPTGHPRAADIGGAVQPE